MRPLKPHPEQSEETNPTACFLPLAFQSAVTQGFCFKVGCYTAAHVSTDSINVPFDSHIFVDREGTERKAEAARGSSGSELCLDDCDDNCCLSSQTR